MNNMYRLSDLATYTKARVRIDSISTKNYVTTDNLLPNRQGLGEAVNLPPYTGNIPAFKAGNILVSNIRPYLRKIWFADKCGGCSADVLTFEVNNNHDPRFVYYAMFQNKFFEHMMRGSKGTKMPRGDKNQIMDFPLPKFNKQIQQKIVGVLSALDAKIKLNNRINAELEAMAKLLFDYWFMQFDFPDTNGNPYKSSGGKMIYNEELKRKIPVGWSNATLDDLGQIVGGSTPSTKEPKNFSNLGIPWITPNDLSNNIGNKFIARGEKDVSERGIKSASLKIYPKGTVLLSSRAPIGYMAIASNELTTNQGFKSFIPNKGFSTEFIYYTIKNSLDTIIQYSSGSTFKEISGSVLKTVKICLPNKEKSNDFTLKIKSIFGRQVILEQENIELIKLRDWLLPMLMNGQVTVR